MRIVAISLFMALQVWVQPVFAQVKPATVESLIQEGDILFKKKGGKREALDKYKAALELNSEDTRANYMAGLCYLQTSQKSKSLLYFLKAYDSEPEFVPEIKVGIDLFPDLRFLIARSFQVGENYQKAEEYYNHFKESLNQGSASKYAQNNRGPALRAAERRIFECLVAEELSKRPIDSKITNLRTINSPYPDYGPVFTPDGKTMFFTSRRAGGASPLIDDDLHFFEDIYSTTRDSTGNWKPAKLVTALCTPGHESVMNISSDGSNMVISKGEGNGDLYISQKGLFGKWGEPVSMGKNINTSARETGAVLVNNGKKIYFTSDRSGGFGGLDLYYSERRSNGKWGTAINLGPKINTMFDEESPSIDPSGTILYFSSKGHKAMGGFDVFKANWDAANLTFKNPENIGFPINSADDDITYVLSPDSGLAYYSSFKENGVGDLDIFHLQKGAPLTDSIKKDRREFMEIAGENVPLLETVVNDLSADSSAKIAQEADRIANREKEANAPIKEFEVAIIDNEPIASTVENGSGYFMFNPHIELTNSENKKETYVRVLLMDTETRIPLDGNVVFTDQDTKEKIIPNRVRNGVYEISTKNKSAKTFMVSAEQEGFHFKNIMVNIPPASNSRSIFLTRNIELKRHTLNKPRVLRNVYFDFNQSDLSTRSNDELDMLHKMLNENEKLIIEVSGHADFIGADDYNNDLSKKRAEKVVEYLAGKGIDKNRMRAQGYGEKKPAAGTDASESGRALNRRTEFMIMAQ